MDQGERLQTLTLREAQVLFEIAQGCTHEKAALRLGISTHTVAAHLKSIYRKLDVHSAGAAVMRAIQLRQLNAGPTLATHGELSCRAQ